jgi:hypothetical protein
VDTIRSSGGHFVKYEEDGWWEIGDNAARWVFEQWLCLYSVNIWYECVLRVLLLAKSLTRFSYPEKRLVLCSGTVFTHSTGRPERPKLNYVLQLRNNNWCDSKIYDPTSYYQARSVVLISKITTDAKSCTIRNCNPLLSGFRTQDLRCLGAFGYFYVRGLKKHLNIWISIVWGLPLAIETRPPLQSRYFFMLIL